MDKTLITPFIISQELHSLINSSFLSVMGNKYTVIGEFDKQDLNASTCTFTNKYLLFLAATFKSLIDTNKNRIPLSTTIKPNITLKPNEAYSQTITI